MLLRVGRDRTYLVQHRKPIDYTLPHVDVVDELAGARLLGTLVASIVLENVYELVGT